MFRDPFEGLFIEEEKIVHVGVKGMKWGVRRDNPQSRAQNEALAKRASEKASAAEAQRQANIAAYQKRQAGKKPATERSSTTTTNRRFGPATKGGVKKGKGKGKAEAKAGGGKDKEKAKAEAEAKAKAKELAKAKADYWARVKKRQAPIKAAHARARLKKSFQEKSSNVSSEKNEVVVGLGASVVSGAAVGGFSGVHKNSYI